MPPFFLDLTFNEATIEELGGHGLRVADAIEVFEGSPKFFPNRGKRRRVRQGLRPRWKMVGKNNGGELLTVVAEGPDEDRIGHIVTAWRSSTADRTRYDQPGGRRNRP